jgi:hypothetical protein
MLVVKTISQFSHVYEVPDALAGDFLRWLSANADSAGDYEVHQEFIHEFIVDARREPDRPIPVSGSPEQERNSQANDAGAFSK